MPNNDYILRSDAVSAFCGNCEGTEVCGQLGEPCEEVKRIKAIPAADVEPVNPDLPQWTRTSEHTPIIPGSSWGSVTVIAVLPGDKVSRPMIYERALVRKKWVERWKWIWDTICDETPVLWMPFPKPPKGEENDTDIL